jgi:hypothetical protein
MKKESLIPKIHDNRASGYHFAAGKNKQTKLKLSNLPEILLKTQLDYNYAMVYLLARIH